MIDTRFDVIAKEIAHESSGMKTLRAVIEKKVNEDLRILLKDSASSKLQLAHLGEEITMTKEAEKEDRESLRQAHTKIEDIVNELKKSSTVTNIIETRLANTAKGVQASWAKGNEVQGYLVKLEECYEKTRGRIIEAEGAIKEVCDAGKQTHQELEDQVRQIEYNSDRLTQALKVIDEGRSANEDIRHQVNSLRQSSDNANVRILSITKEMKDIEAAAFANKAALQEQSTMLLPNIHMDSQDAVIASERHGSLLMSHGVRKAAGGSRGTPRSQKWS